MTTEEKEAQAVLEAPGQDTPDQGESPTQEAGTTAEPGVSSLQEQLEASRSQVLKAQNDLKALQGRNRPLEDMRGLLDQMVGRLDDTQDMVKASVSTTAAIARVIGSGDTDSLPQEIQQIHTEASARQGARSFQEFKDSLWAEIGAALVDDDGNVILDGSAPELQHANQTWWASADAGDRGGMANALLEVNQVVRRAERAKNKESIDTARKEGQDRAVRDRNRQDADIDSGGGSGVATGDAAEIWKAFGRGERPWSLEVLAAGKALGVSE
jgi:hypothetical protein